MWTFRLDPSDGQMTLLSVNADDKTTVNPAFSRVHPTKNILYACTESVETNGEVLTWKVNPKTGMLNLIGRADACGTSTCYITLDRQAKRALIVNYWNSTIVVLTILPKIGAISSTSPFIFDPNRGRVMSVSHKSHVNHSENDENAQKERQLDPHSHAVILDPFFGKIVFVPDLGMDLIRQMVYDENTGIIQPRGFVKSGPPGKVALGPRYIEFHPSLHVAYVVNELSSEVAVFAFDKAIAQEIISSASGQGNDDDAVKQTLSLFQNVRTIPEGFPQEMNTCGRITVHSSGRFVLVSNRGHDSLSVFKVDSVTGKLYDPKFYHTRGSTPRHFQFDPSGQWLIVANQDSNSIKVFQFNLSTGAIDYTGNTYAVPSPNFVCCFAPRSPSVDSDEQVLASRL